MRYPPLRGKPAKPHLRDIGNHTIVRCAIGCRLLVCAWGWGMEDTVALKVTRKNLQRLAEAFANDAADPYQNFHRADVMAHFKMNIEDAWSEGVLCPNTRFLLKHNYQRKKDGKERIRESC